MDVVLIDLYDTLVWSEWSKARDLLAMETGVDTHRWTRGFIDTRVARGIGTFGSAEGDLRAVLSAAGVELDDEEAERAVALERPVLVDGGVRLYEDSLPAVRDLRKRGIRTGSSATATT